MMGKLRHISYLSMMFLLLEIILLALPSTQAGGDDQAQAISIPVPCAAHLVCWLYCQFIIKSNQGSGCCFPKKFEDEKKNLVSLPGLEKVCYCCTGLDIISLVPTAVDTYCDNIQPVVNNVTDLTSSVTLLENLCLAGKKNKKCMMVQIGVGLSLFDPLKGCDDAQGGGLGDVTDVLPIIG